MRGVTQALQNAQWVLYDEANFVNVTLASGSMSCAVGTISAITQVQGQVFGSTALYYVADVGVALPVFTIVAAIVFNVGTANVAGHEAQARHAELGHIKVVANLPGVFALGAEVVVLNVVQQVNRTAAVVAVFIATFMVAFNCLRTNGESM